MDVTRKQDYLRAWGNHYRAKISIPDEAAKLMKMTTYDFVDAVRIQCKKDDKLYTHIREIAMLHPGLSTKQKIPIRQKDFHGSWAPSPSPTNSPCSSPELCALSQDII
jgi:hypothetical protein